MKNFFFSILCFTLFVSASAQAQTVKRWTLKECIDYTIANNYQAAQSRLQLNRNEANLLQSKGNLLPSLNGSANHTYNTGRRIDPFTNQFANSVVLSQNFSLSSGMNLFSGMQNYHTIRAGQLGVKASEYSNTQIDNDIALNVANAFLQILLSEELVTIARNQLELTRSQTERAKLLFESGRTARGDYLQVEAQLANEELNLVNARNRYEQAILTLVQMMALDTAEGFEVEKPDFSELTPELPPYNVREVYTGAVESFPGVLSADYNYMSQERLLKASRGGLLPALSVFGGIGTGYSQLSRTQVGSSIQQQYLGEFQGNPVFIDVNVPVFEKTPFNQQWTQNFNRTVGFSLNVPIFNNFRTRTQISNQRISLENARLQKLITRNNLLRDIQTAWFDAKSAYERYRATEKSVSAIDESFAYIQQRFDVGLVNTLEYTTSKNQLATSRSNLAQARYEFIFRSKVLDFYRGKPIQF